MKYVAVIVTFNRKVLLMESIQSLLKQTVKPFKIVVIDNHSTDGTEERFNDSFTENQKELIDYVRLQENIGGSGGFHEGIKKAMRLNPDWISVADDDAMYKPDFFANIEDHVKKYPKILAFSGTVVGGGHVQQHRKKILSNVTLKEKPFAPETYKKDFYCDLFTFVGVVFSTKLISRVGLPRKDYFIWYDDSEYALRIRKYTKVLNLANSVIEHKDETGSDARKPSWKDYYGIRNQTDALLKYTTNRFTAVVYSLVMIVLRDASVFIRPRYKNKRLYALRSFTQGYVDGLRGKMGKNTHYLPGSK